MAKLILFNKPFGVISQFGKSGDKTTLGEFINFKGVYPAGRLDTDSEGLLLLTDNGPLQHQITHPKHKQPKTYWVQVEGEINDETINHLEQGVLLKDGPTRRAKARIISPPDLWPRHPPIRSRQSVPTSWLELTITEGKNRQVRRMTAALGFPTLRLVRTTIGKWQLGCLKPGEFSCETIHMPIKNQTKRK